MNLTCDQLTERLLHVFHSHYRVSPVDDGSFLRAVCDFQSTTEHRLGRRIRLWTGDTHRLLYLTYVPELNFQTLADCRQLALDDSTLRIQPAPGHRCTDEVCVLILCDRAQPDALDTLIRSKLPASCRRPFPNRLSFRVAAVDLSTGETTCNRTGRALKKLLSAAGLSV